MTEPVDVDVFADERGELRVRFEGVKMPLRPDAIGELYRIIAEIGADIQDGHPRLSIGAKHVVDEVLPGPTENDPRRNAMIVSVHEEGKAVRELGESPILAEIIVGTRDLLVSDARPDRVDVWSTQFVHHLRRFG